ncbi:unnamed protein product [Penicillium egyptiacum]|uniref:Uncharacterized protein n=1 Tax=Penicillium egyptiacum TaxID=1303716 RepID=A0A9W4K3S2_9EURO|nr:unnamed protein product [Penicillium egyptiacum]
MTTFSNIDTAAIPNQGAHKVTGEDPIMHSGHKLGLKVNEADERDEYHMKAFPSGTAPASNSYTPDPVPEVSGLVNNPNEDAEEGTFTSAGDSLMGSTSGDVNRGLGRPMQGQTNIEVNHDGQHGRKKDETRLEGVGAEVQDRRIKRRFADQRGLDRE